MYISIKFTRSLCCFYTNFISAYCKIILDKTNYHTQAVGKLQLEHMNLNDFSPTEFSPAFYLTPGKERINPLSKFLSALILQKVVYIPSYSLLIILLSICNEFQDVYGFQKFLNAPLFIKFEWEISQKTQEKGGFGVPGGG